VFEEINLSVCAIVPFFDKKFVDEQLHFRIFITTFILSEFQVTQIRWVSSVIIVVYLT
jgi:hypothetical protein